jgi:hypothetical protein
MPRHAERPLALLLAVALSACAIDDVGDSVTDTRDAVVGSDVARMPQEEFPEVRTNCRLPGTTLTRHPTGWRLALPPETYAARNSQPAAGRIACVTDWARGRGLTLTIAEAR